MLGPAAYIHTGELHRPPGCVAVDCCLRLRAPMMLYLRIKHFILLDEAKLQHGRAYNAFTYTNYFMGSLICRRQSRLSLPLLLHAL